MNKIKLMIHFQEDAVPFHVDLPEPLRKFIEENHPDARYFLKSFLKAKFPTYRFVGDGAEEYDAFPVAE